MTGTMRARVSVAGTIVHVDNRYLAVWVREHGAWKFVAYQPTSRALVLEPLFCCLGFSRLS